MVGLSQGLFCEVESIAKNSKLEDVVQLFLELALDSHLFLAEVADESHCKYEGACEDTRKKTEDKRLAKCTFGSQGT